MQAAHFFRRVRTMTGQADTIKNREQWLEEHRKIENYILIYGCGLICFLKKI